MTKTPEQEANELVEMFANELEERTGRSNGAINISILHVERLIEILELHDTWEAVCPHYQQVLQILKDKK